MSVNTLDTIIGRGRQAVQYAGAWALNTNVNRTAGGDYEFPPSAFTNDTVTFNNVNAAALVNPSTTTFAITFPVSGKWSISWYHRMVLNMNASTTVVAATYLSGHVMNGLSSTALGTPSPTERRPAEQDTFITNTATNGASPSIQQTASVVQEFKAGDTIAPAAYAAAPSWYSFGNATPQNSSSRLTVTLLQQTV